MLSGCRSIPLPPYTALHTSQLCPTITQRKGYPASGFQEITIRRLSLTFSALPFRPESHVSRDPAARAARATSCRDLSWEELPRRGSTKPRPVCPNRSSR